MEEAANIRRKVGIHDAANRVHQVRAYATFPITGDNAMLDMLLRCCYEFGAVGCGFRMPQSALDQFDQGKPWSVVPGSPSVGGHYVPIIGRNSVELPLGVTWGRVTAMTPDFIKEYLDQVVVFFSNDYINSEGKTPHGVDVSALNRDIVKLGSTAGGGRMGSIDPDKVQDYIRIIDQELNKNQKLGGAPVGGAMQDTFCTGWPHAEPLLQNAAALVAWYPHYGGLASVILKGLLAIGDDIYKQGCSTAPKKP
jgi:hypothetical protein